MVNSNDATSLDKQKQELEQRVYATTEKALNDNKITLADARAIGGYIIEEFDEAESSDDINAVVTVLAEEWPIFSDLLTAERGKANRMEEQQGARMVATMVKQGSFTRALATAKHFLKGKAK